MHRKFNAEGEKNPSTASPACGISRCTARLLTRAKNAVQTVHTVSSVDVPKFEPGSTPGYIYEMMANHLAARILGGEFTPNKPLPSERRLAEEYNVSLGTARHATRLLRYRGLVITIRSKGTYVADPRRYEQS